MAKVALLVDTDVFIDYFNSGTLSALFDSPDLAIYCSVVTRKELLSKPGLREAERNAVAAELARFRLVKLGPTIAARYSELRRRYPSLQREGALIAAIAVMKRMPLLTRNQKHFRVVAELTLLSPR